MRRGTHDKECFVTKSFQKTMNPTIGPSFGPFGALFWPFKPWSGPETEQKIVGICLGYDGVVEHEEGIAGLQKDFGIRGDAGENRATDATVCTVTTVPEDLKFFPNPYGSHAYLLYKPFALYINQEPENRTSEILDYRLGLYDKIRGEDFSTAWSDGDFGIRLKNDRRFRGGFFLREIYEAFQKKDVMIFVNNDRKNPFGTKGLMIVIRSHVPEDILEQMEQEWAETIPDTATSPTQSA